MMAAMAPAHDEPSSAPVRTDLAAAYREHYRSLVRLASLLVDDVGRCEEIVQDAFVKVWRRPPTSTAPTGSPPTSAAPCSTARAPTCVTAASSAATSGRSPRRRKRPSARPRPATTTGSWPRSASLPARQREVLALRYYLDLSEAEIADTLGISAGSVKTHAHRGLATLAERLEDLR